MTEAGLPAKRAAALAFVAGVALAWLALPGGVAAMAGVLLAQPVLALAVSWQRGTRTFPGAVLKRGFPLLVLAWGFLFALAAVVVAWPLRAMLADASLMAALGLSAAVGAAVIGLWQSWPLWHGLLRGSRPVAELRRSLSGSEISAWRGLGVAAGVALVLFAGIALVWPGLLPDIARTAAVAIYAFALPGLHWLIQRPAEPEAKPATLQIVTMQAPAEPAHESVPESGDDPDSALYEAARRGRVERALEWLESGADPHALPLEEARDQRSLGVLAAVLPDLRLLRALIAAGLDVNHVHAGMTPLLAATRDSWHGRPEAVTTLLANGADPRAIDAEGNTPLHHAARSSDPGVVALLLDAAADIDALNHEGRTPLGIACVAGNWRLAKFLLQHGARPDPASGLPALLAAAATEEDDPAGVQLLLKHKAKLEARDAAGRSALHEAAFAGHADIVTALLAAGADVQARDQHGRTPWLSAARGGQAGVLDALAQAGADVAAVDVEGCNALVLACTGTVVPVSLVQRLLAAGVDPAQPDHQGRHAVNLAAGAGRWAVVSALDPAYPLPAAVAVADDTARPDRAPASLVLDALGNGDTSSLESLLALCTPEELGRLLHEPGVSPEQQAWLLRQGAAAEVCNAQGNTPLFAALARGTAGIAIARVFLSRGVSPAGRGGLALYLAASVRMAAGTDAEAFALELLERGADPFGASTEGDAPLSLTVRLGWSCLLDRLLDLGVDREFRDGHGMTALHLAAALGREEAVRQLVKKGASPEARAADGQTPLGIALASGRRDLADWLEWRGWALPRRVLRASDLPAAAMAGDREAVRRLLDLGFPVDSVDVQGCSALLRAAGGGHKAVAELLIARGADLEHAANTGATPLSAAVSMRHVELVSDLLAAGAQIEHRLPGGVTVLMLASALGLPDIAARLLAAGADVHAGDAQELAPLHCAALFGFVARDRVRLLALFDALLLAGAEPERVAAGAVTPLLLLLGARAEPGTAHAEEVVLAALERLLEEGISLDVQDPRGFGPLHLAALHGMLRVVQRLLRAGADPDLRDALNRPPREIAVMRGFIDVAAEFVPAVPGASMARFLREPRG